MTKKPLSPCWHLFCLLREATAKVAFRYGHGGVAAAPAASEPHQNFEDWFADCDEEVVEERICTIQDENGAGIPPYVHGTSIRNGPALWSAGDYTCQHAFDGAAFLTQYKINSDENAQDQQVVTFRARFVQSNQLDAMLHQDTIPLAISVGAILKAGTGQAAFEFWGGL